MKITAKQRKKAFKVVNDILKPTYFLEIPMGRIMNALKTVGLVVLQEDNTEWSGFLLGKNEHETFTLGFADKATLVNGVKVYEEVSNSVLVLSWYNDDSRSGIEVTGYIS